MDEHTDKGALATEGDVNTSSEEKEDFAQLLEEATRQSGRLNPGQKVETKVVAISGDFVYVDAGGKSDGLVPVSEFIDDEGKMLVNIGDLVTVFFVSADKGEKKFTTRIKGYTTLNLAEIRDAYEAGVPVTGKVTAETKGGYEVMVGKVRCFCPKSQIDVRWSQTPETYVGETFPFKVLEYKEEGLNVILSRRVVLEEERELQVRELRESLAAGQEIKGRVKSIQKFGIFVDIGGIDGLIPLSELGWGTAGNVEELFSVGQEVLVKVISVDWEKNRLTFSLKALQEDPWKSVSEKYTVDSLVRGTVVRLAPFGAFVNLEPGIDGLVHISKLGAGRRVNHPKEVLELGKVVEAQITGIDVEKKRISLSLEPFVSPTEIEMPLVGDVLDVKVAKVMSFGLIVRINKDLTGLIPNGELGLPPGTNLSKTFVEGASLQAVVTEVNEGRKRVTLSRARVDEKIEEEELVRYKEQLAKDEVSRGSLGSFGELLREKFGNLKRG